MSIIRNTLFISSVWILLACGPGGEPPPPTGLLAGERPVEVGPVAAVPEVSWEVGADPRVRIGGDEKDESTLLVQVGDAGVTEDGTIVVADARSGVVRTYDASGRFLATLGAAGDGPGEFRQPTDVFMDSGDTILVWDQTHWRTSTFTSDGAFQGSERYDPTDADLFPVRGMWPSGVRLGPEGAYLVRLQGKANAKGANGGSEPPEEGVMGFARHLPESGELDLVASLPEPAALQVAAPWGRQEMVPALAGGPRAVMDPRDRRVCVGYSGVPEILCWNDPGPSTSVRWPSDRGPVQAMDPDVARWRQETLADYSQKLSRREVEDLLSQVSLPERQPAFRGLHLDDLGLLWVELGPPGEEWGIREYLILRRDLEPMGRIELPSLRILEIGVDYILGVREDSMGREEVVLHSLSR